MNLHGTVVDKFEGDVLAEMLNNKWLDLDGNTRYMYMLVRWKDSYTRKLGC